MENYESDYTGLQIDTVIDLVNKKSEDWTEKQEKLEDGKNIKTINNNSILGEGNLTLETGKVDDVKLDGTSIVTNKIANIDSTKFGKIDDVQLDGVSIVKDKIASIDSTKFGKIDDVKVDGTSVVDENKIANIDLSGKQETLVSGTNIKTINKVSILGEGNIDVQCGEGKVNDVKQNGTSVVTDGVANVTTGDNIYVGDGSSASATLDANTLEGHPASYFAVAGTDSKNFVDVKIFGAVGDGTTDDTVAIQSAIDYCLTNHRTLFLSKGSYIISSTLTCCKKDFTFFNIIGDDIDNVSLHYTGVGEMFNMYSIPGTVNHIVIEGFDITVPLGEEESIREGTTAFLIRGVDGVLFRRLKIANFDKVVHCCNDESGNFAEYDVIDTCDVTNCNYVMYMDIEDEGTEASMHGNGLRNSTIRDIRKYPIYIGPGVFWYNGIADFTYWYDNLNPFIYNDSKWAITITGDIKFECCYQPEEESSQVAPTIFGGSSTSGVVYFGGTIQGIGGYGNFCVSSTLVSGHGTMLGQELSFTDKVDYHSGYNYGGRAYRMMEANDLSANGTNLFYVNLYGLTRLHKVTFHLYRSDYDQYGYFYYTVKTGSTVVLSEITNITPLVNDSSRNISFIWNKNTNLIYLYDSNSSTRGDNFTQLRMYDEEVNFGGN